MANSICYLIALPGISFNVLMSSSHQAPSLYIDTLEKSKDCDFWDGKLPNNDAVFLVDLSGLWTLIKYPCSYSAWLFSSKNDELTKQVKAWERCLQGLLPTVAIYRIDDFLLDQWNSKYDYLLIRDSNGLKGFLEWLPDQDNRYWALLNSHDKNPGNLAAGI